MNSELAAKRAVAQLLLHGARKLKTKKKNCAEPWTNGGSKDSESCHCMHGGFKQNNRRLRAMTIFIHPCLLQEHFEQSHF